MEYLISTVITGAGAARVGQGIRTYLRNSRMCDAGHGTTMAAPSRLASIRFGPKRTMWIFLR